MLQMREEHRAAGTMVGRKQENSTQSHKAIKEGRKKKSKEINNATVEGRTQNNRHKGRTKTEQQATMPQKRGEK